jgi:hypothetical protein
MIVTRNRPPVNDVQAPGAKKMENSHSNSNQSTCLGIEENRQDLSFLGLFAVIHSRIRENSGRQLWFETGTTRYCVANLVG